MTTKRTSARAPAADPARRRSTDADVRAALAWLTSHATKKTLTGMARFGIPSDAALGVSLADIHVLAKRCGRDQDLACALWETGVYEARLLAALVGDPAKLKPSLMDRWCRDFDSWAVCDTVCFHLFDRSPHAWSRIRKWCGARDEFVKRAAFALLASVAGHDRTCGDEPFLDGLKLVESAAADERNFVKKGVNWALRRIGTRNRALHAAAVDVAARLAESADRTERWVGRGALRELRSAATLRRIERS